MRDVIDRLSLGFMGSARGRSRVTRAVVVIEQVAGAHDLACAPGQGGARVLAIDFDPQFALTRRFGVSPAGRPTFLARALRGVFDRYDVVLVDCPPNLGLLTVNALCAADQEPCVSGEAPTASNA